MRVGNGGKEGPRGACTCIGGPGMNARSSGCRCAGDIDSLMCRACRCVLYTPTSVASVALLPSGMRVGDMREGRALICLAPQVKTHAPSTSFDLGVDQNRFNRLVWGVLMSECHCWNSLTPSRIDRCVKVDGRGVSDVGVRWGGGRVDFLSYELCADVLESESLGEC